MEISQLRYFLDTAQTQHITQSSQRLRISQPALTKSIHKLEDELGVPLFVHKGRNVLLTKYGIYLKNKLAPIIAQLDSIPSDIAEMNEVERHTVRLSVLAASTFVTRAIIEYKRIHPEINFHVMQNSENELFDIEIATSSAFGEKKFKNEDAFVCTEKIFLAVPDTEKYGSLKSVRLADVRNEGFISLLYSRQLRNICDEFCRRAGFEANIIFESDSPYAVQNMIAANIGIGFWPEFTWGKIGSDSVKLLEIDEPQCERDIVITHANLKTDNTHTRDFYEFLKHSFLMRE